MQEIEFTKEDEYCIRNFGYNNVKDYEDLKQLEDEKHLIVEELEYRLQQKENIIKEVRECAKRELKIAEENIKNSEQWLEVEEEQEHAKRDIHTGKVIKRDMKIFLEILDKGE